MKNNKIKLEVTFENIIKNSILYIGKNISKSELEICDELIKLFYMVQDKWFKDKNSDFSNGDGWIRVSICLNGKEYSENVLLTQIKEHGTSIFLRMTKILVHKIIQTERGEKTMINIGDKRTVRKLSFFPTMVEKKLIWFKYYFSIQEYKEIEVRKCRDEDLFLGITYNDYFYPITYKVRFWEEVDRKLNDDEK